MKTQRGTAHLSKRVWQTGVLFRNFPVVVKNLALAETRLAPKEMTFRMRNGYTVVTPNADGARFPLYEVFADDGYRLEALTAGVSPDASILDIGGQIGSFSLALAQALPRASIHVYEASPTSASYISRNMTMNGLDGRVVVHACALSGEEGTFTFVDSGTASGHNGLTAPEGLGEEVTVPATTFDAAVAALPTALEIVKIDIEGAEYDVLLNSSPESWSTVKHVVMEYHPLPGHSLDELLAFFSSLGIEETHHDPGTRAGLGVMWLSRA